MLLEINNLFFSHNKENPLFQNLNLRFEENRIIALAGESGCGKSTLLNLIYGLLDWESGEIIFNGTKLSGPKGNLVPGEPEMKFVAQNFDLMPYATVAENVGKFISNINLAKKKETVLELLDVVGLVEFADVLPKNLSGGQQQRVAIARALVTNPPLMLCDEPTAALDTKSVSVVMDELKMLSTTGKSVAVVTHDLRLKKFADRIIYVNNGMISDHQEEEDMLL